jgi:hypothetical protein
MIFQILEISVLLTIGYNLPKFIQINITPDGHSTLSDLRKALSAISLTPFTSYVLEKAYTLIGYDPNFEAYMAKIQAGQDLTNLIPPLDPKPPVEPIPAKVPAKAKSVKSATKSTAVKSTK